MNLQFNPLPANLSQALATAAQRQHRTVEQVALEALQRGLAFDPDTQDDVTWVEDPHFDQALQTYAQMEHE